ncbi:heterokaryon incompatibility protein-domain-containing protein [Nemania sp. FL0031]|nr:heterokaryon incompatibility protein-domain-containing protein [Nemania sp. FL0031]
MGPKQDLKLPDGQEPNHDLEAIILALLFQEKVVNSLANRPGLPLGNELHRLEAIWLICVDYGISRLPHTLQSKIKVTKPHGILLPTAIPRQNPIGVPPLEILLLVVRPSRDASSIVSCQICRAPLGSTGAPRPAYDVLSYAWGDPSKTRHLELDGKDVEITEGLESALKHLRHQEKPQLVWVDPLCIDHRNGQKRGSSPEYLRYIYAAARRVIVWLGNQCDDEREVFKLLETLKPLDLNNQRVVFQQVFRNTRIAPRFKPFRKLLERPWWDRAGLLLQLMRGCKITVQCGNDSADWESFLQVFSILHEKGQMNGNVNLRYLETLAHAIYIVPGEVSEDLIMDGMNSEGLHTNLDAFLSNLERIFAGPKPDVNWVLALFKVSSHLGPILTHLAEMLCGSGISKPVVANSTEKKLGSDHLAESSMEKGFGGSVEDAQVEVPVSSLTQNEEPSMATDSGNVKSWSSDTATAGIHNLESKCWLRVLEALATPLKRTTGAVIRDSTRGKKLEDYRTIYEPLDPAARAFRMLKIDPTDRVASPIYCEHIPVDLDALNALNIRKCPLIMSYDFVETAGQNEIFLNGNKKLIGCHQLALLRDLRNPNIPTFLWLDSLCIDQDNPDEKSLQTDLKASISQYCARILTKSHEQSKIYQRLLIQNLEIRVLNLLPASDPCAPIECTLHTVSLQDDVRFTALSYVWGDPSVTTTITLNGETFPVTINLGAALRRFRDPDNVVVIWADAICVDQSNLSERSEQVQLMERIYICADQVLAWLGEEADNSNVGMDAIEKWAYWSTSMKGKTVENLSKIEDTIPDAFNKDTIKAIWHILERPFWSRVWIIQEAVLAKELNLICGTKKLSWELVGEAVHCWFRLSDTAYLHNYSYGEWEAMNTISSGRPRLMMYLRNSGPSGSKLRTLVEFCIDYQATDPRDKIYGLYGVASDSSVLITPDYTKTVGEVYRSFTSAVIQQEESLEVIRSAGWGLPRIDTNFELPSWVPDWRGTGDTGITLLEGSYQAGGNTRYIVRVSGSSKTLRAFGSSCGEISDLRHGDIYSSSHGWASFCEKDMQRTYRTGIPVLQAFFRIIVLDMDWEEKRLTSDSERFFDLAAAFFFALGLLNQEPSGKGDNENPSEPEGNRKSSEAEHKHSYNVYETGNEPDYVHYFRKWLGQERAGRSDQTILEPFLGPPNAKSTIIWPEPSDVERGGPPEESETKGRGVPETSYLKRGTRHFMNFTTMVARRMRGKCLFKTNNGYMGIGPVGLKKEDIVVVLYGCSVPVILRKVKDRYALIGECYVLGLMDGEAAHLEKGVMEGFRII